MFTIKRYLPSDTQTWNDFVAKSKNATFLFDRHYMDYHQDRFEDYSLMIYKGNKLYALFPANINGETVFSHQGLTYGGLILSSAATAANITDLFVELNGWFKEHHIKKVEYKAVPWPYHKLPAEEDLFALTNICHARLTVRKIASVINLENTIKFGQSRRTGVHHAEKAGLTIMETDDLKAFWDILEENLQEKYHAHAVHTLKEMENIKANFPKKIRLFMAYDGTLPVGGTLIYDFGHIVHTQYISASNKGKKVGALDFIFDRLIHDTFADRKYFDFGTSMEKDNATICKPLIFQKEGFGGRGVCYDTYEWETT